jgi:hypothetical protein
MFKPECGTCGGNVPCETCASPCRGCGRKMNRLRALDVEHELECVVLKLDAARKLAVLRADITKDQGQPGEAESWRKLLEVLK